MIAHGFVVVGLFSSLTSFLDDMKHELSLKWGIRTQSPRFALFLLLVLACCSSYYFQLCWRVYGLIQPSQINVWFAFLGGMTIILGAYYMLKM
jgi:NADH-quinone oxidoreductase subunit M